MIEKQEQEQTFGLVSMRVKTDTVKELKKHQAKLNIIIEGQFELSVEAAKQHLKREIKNQLPVYAFVLEGFNAVQEWLNIVKTLNSITSAKRLIHGSAYNEAATLEIGWFNSMLLSDLSITTRTLAVTGGSFTSSSTTKSLRKLSTSVSSSSPSVSSSATGPTIATSQKQQAKKIIPVTMKPSSSSSSSSSNKKNKEPSIKKPMSKGGPTVQKKMSRIPNSKASQQQQTAAQAKGKTGGGSSSNTISLTSNKGGIIKKMPAAASISARRPRKISRITTTNDENGSKNMRLRHGSEKLKENMSTPSILEASEVALEKVKEDGKERKQPMTVVTDSSSSSSNLVPDPPLSLMATTKSSYSLHQPTCSTKSVATSTTLTEEHDAEVAATTSRRLSLFADLPPLLSSSGSAATTPTSARSSCFSPVSSLTQHLQTQSPLLPYDNVVGSSSSPPEVEQLRLRFETIIQLNSLQAANKGMIPRALLTASTMPSGHTSSSSNNSYPDLVATTSQHDESQQQHQHHYQRRRRSSRLSSEFAARIKEMKPRGPVGSRVKSMVEFFMDENLNKWEF